MDAVVKGSSLTKSQRNGVAWQVVKGAQESKKRKDRH